MEPKYEKVVTFINSFCWKQNQRLCPIPQEEQEAYKLLQSLPAFEGYLDYWLNIGRFYRATVMLQREANPNKANLHISYSHFYNVSIVLFAKICHEVFSAFSGSLATHICYSAVITHASV